MLVIFLVLLICAFFSIVWFTLKNGISPMPTSAKVKHVFLNSLPTKNSGAILELGAGWGTLAFALAARYPNCKVLAYENSWVPFIFCKIRYFVTPYSNLKFVRCNFFDKSFSQATLIVCYLYPGAMEKLQIKFEQELEKDTLIATHTFSLRERKPFLVIHVKDLYNTPIFHYRIKNKTAR